MVVTDYNGNIIDPSQYSDQADALEKGFNVDCTDCNNCTQCVGCTDCVNCHNCTNCIDCWGCTFCYKCNGCKVCISCAHCTGCINMGEAYRCNETPIQIHGLRWPVTIRQNGTMKIGCQEHPIEKWQTFDDARIDRMSSYAAEWWDAFKSTIMQLIKAQHEYNATTVKEADGNNQHTE